MATASSCCRKSGGATPSFPVVLITAYGSIDMARAAFKSGAQDYITKPWSNDELLSQVSLAIEGPQAARRKRPAEARPQAALQLPQHHRQERKAARGAGPGDAGGAVALHRADIPAKAAPARN
jgi:FixJ family two-component response regulator